METDSSGSFEIYQVIMMMANMGKDPKIIIFSDFLSLFPEPKINCLWPAPRVPRSLLTWPQTHPNING